MKMREEKREERKRHAVKDKQYKRGVDDDEAEFIQEISYTKTYANNNLTEWGTVMKASEFWEEIEGYVAQQADNGEDLSSDRDEDKKKFFIANDPKGLKIKVKFFDCVDEATLKVNFIKKSGNITDFYALLKHMQSVLNEHLVTVVE